MTKTNKNTMSKKNTSNCQRKNWQTTTNFAHDQAHPMNYFPNFAVIPNIKFVIVALEQGEESGLLHWQAFIQCEPRIRGSQIIAALPGSHITPHDENAYAGINYVKKNPISGPFTWRDGTWDIQPHYTPRNIFKITLNALLLTYQWIGKNLPEFDHEHTHDLYFIDHILYQVLAPITRKYGKKLKRNF